MSDEKNDSLGICSLQDLHVHLATPVRDYLASQFRGLYEDEDGHDSKTAASIQHMNRILEAMKIPPARTICRVNLLQSTREQVIEELQTHVDEWQRGTNSTNVTTVRPHLIFKDVVCIESSYPNTNTVSSLSNSSIPILRVSNNDIPSSSASSTDTTPLFQSWSSREIQGWPMTHRVVVCDRYCGEAVLRGSDIFVRGVLAADGGIASGDVVAVYAAVASERRPNDATVKPVAIKRGLLLKRLTAYHQYVFLGLGTASCSRSEFFSSQQGVAVRMSPDPRIRAGPALPPLSGVLPGKMMLQNLPSLLVAHVLGAQEGEVILDMCSAPGGKTSHVASLVGNRATIVACDKSRRKMVSARAFFRVMGATCIVPLAWDSTNCVIRDGSPRQSVHEILSSASVSDRDDLLNVKEFHPESFDRIILDPPCSALGLRPKLQIDFATVADLEKHVRYQRSFVKEAVSLLKPGGTLTYSTCTIHAAENERMVRGILDSYPELTLVPIGVELGLSGLPGMGLSDHERHCVRRFDPSDAECDTMGFFVAKFVKSTA